MSIIEKISNIGEVVNELIEFLDKSERIKSDWNEYKKTLNLNSENEIKAQAITYIFERKLPSESKKSNLEDESKNDIELEEDNNNNNNKDESIISIYIDSLNKIPRIKKKLLSALLNSFDSVFQVKKIGSNGFVLYNLVNEKDYNVISMVKMTHFRHIGCGDFILARIFEYESDFYILEIRDCIKEANKDNVMKYAVAKIIENPKLLYTDNKDKLKQIEKNIASMYKKFLSCFKTDEIITSSKKADMVLELFNAYDQTGKNISDEQLSEIKDSELNYGYIKISDFDMGYDNFIEKSLFGFSSHKQEYDVGIIFDKQLGFYAIPFYGTLIKIFEVEDYKSIANYKECVLSFLENDKIPSRIFEKLNTRFENFMEVINKILESNYSFEELLSKYKSEYLESKIYSPTSILYSSNTFSEVLQSLNIKQEFNQEKLPQEAYNNIGRNDPCPCGSGKKYKKCCLKHLTEV